MASKLLSFVGIGLGALAVPLLSQDATAGVKYTSPVYVYVSPTYKYASGGIGYARNTTTTNDYIGCAVYQYATSVSVWCSATNTAGTFLGCSTSNPVFVNAVRSMGMDSHIGFDADASGNCTYIYVEAYSYNQPKVL